MNWYEEKQERKRERLEDRAAKLRREGEARFESGMNRLRAIPFGQPILVGHHSERRDRNYRSKAVGAVDKGIELQKQAGELEARAAAVGSGGISSDDPEAVVKLKQKLVNLESEQRRMTAINAAWRKAGKPKADDSEGWRKVADNPAVMMNPNDLLNVRKMMASDFLDRAPFTYQLTNNNGNINRIKARIATLERNENRETKETEVEGGIRMVENADINRVQLFFPGKPSAEVRTMLKSYGFRWSPTEGAWQRQLNGRAVWVAQEALKAINEGKVQ